MVTNRLNNDIIMPNERKMANSRRADDFPSYVMVLLSGDI